MILRTITFDDELWQVVPKEATMYQVAVGARHSSESDHIVARGQAIAIYDTMLAAAPEPPAQQPAWFRVIDEALLMRNLGVLNQEDDYDTATQKLGKLIEWEIDVACDPAVGGDRVRKQQPMTDEQADDICEPYGYFRYGDAQGDKRRALVRAVEQFHGIR